MRVPDVNVLLYAYNKASAHHATAKSWLEQALSGTEQVGLAWVSLLGFLRIATHPGAFPKPLSPGEALNAIDEWLAHPYTAVPHPGDRHAAILRRLLEAAGVAGDLTTDAHLAAIAIEHDAALATFDADFHRFEGLKLEYLG